MEVDLTKHYSCHESPLTRLIGLLDEGVDDIIVKIKRDALPVKMAELIAQKKGYAVSVLEEDGDTVKLRFLKR